MGVPFDSDQNENSIPSPNQKSQRDPGLTSSADAANGGDADAAKETNDVNNKNARANDAEGFKLDGGAEAGRTTLPRNGSPTSTKHARDSSRANENFWDLDEV